VEEGRQIEAGSPPESSDKVVRLPRDWLGPREDLVPFGPSTPLPFAPEDFWGERAAAIHSVVQAPAAEPPGDAPADDRPAPARKPRLRHQRLAAAAALAGVAAAGAVALLLGGSPNHVTGGARLNIAAIVSDGVSRIWKAGPPRIITRATSPRPVRHVRHRSPRPKPAPARAQHHTSPPRATSYVSHASPSSPQPAYRPTETSPARRIVTTRSRVPSTTSSAARVTPTGQNSALGPVQSPNG
jgi:hypothetical protein